MPPEQIDWTFEDIPAEPAGPSFDGPPPPPADKLTPRRPRRPLPRWLIPATLVIALLIVLGAYIFQRIGWARIEAQLQAEVALEDRYVREGEVQLALNLIGHDDEIWFRIRLAEMDAGLPAPLPAPHLLPLRDEPRVTRVDAVSNDLFAVTVLRRYTDPAGQVVEFEQVATYRDLGPGLWQHVAPVSDAAQPLVSYLGTRLTAYYPAVDAAWLKTVLPQVEANLVQACVDWECPPNVVVPLTFYTDARPARPPVWWSALADPPLNGPLIFSLAPQPPTYPPSLKLPAPVLAGRPHDAPAAATLVRTLTVEGLAFIAAGLTRSDRTAGDYYLDALVARAEQRLGLAAPLPPTLLPPEAAWPPGLLWNPTPGDFNSSMLAEQPERVLALQFLNTALDGQPASLDAQLLDSLRQRGVSGLKGLGPWLTAALGREAAAQAYTRWAAVLDAQALQPVGPDLGVLLLTCNDGEWLLNNGHDAVIMSGAAFTQPPAGADALSPDGRYFAYLDRAGQNVIHVVDLETGEDDQVAIDPGQHLTGWTAHNQLLYVNGPRSHLWRYFPRAHFAQELLAQPVSGGQAGWMRDRLSLLLIRYPDNGDRSSFELVQLTVGGGAIVTPLVQNTSLFALSADDTRLAYVVIEPQPNGDLLWQLELMDLVTGDSQMLLTSAEAAAQLAALPLELQPDVAVMEGPILLNALAWSPDGRQLNLTLGSVQRALYLFNLAVDQPASLQLMASSDVGLLWSGGFSADSRYLAYRAVNFKATTENIFSTVLTVIDLTTGEQQTLPGGMNDGAWSPSGHTLAVAGSEGVFLQDVVTGAQTQIASQSCGGVEWYAPPAAATAGD